MPVQILQLVQMHACDAEGRANAHAMLGLVQRHVQHLGLVQTRVESLQLVQTPV